jgi:putative RNA 2'-phosphotransferase
MSAEGWALIEDVCKVLRMDRTALAAAVQHNDKARLEVDGDRIRACQGHSAEGMPVTREALENSWRRVRPVEELWHGTNLGVLDLILRTGLHPGRRTHVHLAPSQDSHVGRRSRVDVLLGIDPAKLDQPVFQAPNGVLLVRSVPPEAISQVLKTDAVHGADWSGR